MNKISVFFLSIDARCLLIDRLSGMQVELEPSSFSTKKYELFAKYQMAIHHEPEYKCKPKNFTHFLVDSPLTVRIPRRFNLRPIASCNN